MAHFVNYQTKELPDKKKHTHSVKLESSIVGITSEQTSATCSGNGPQ